MIEVNHITKRFGKVTAVDDFTLDINRGSVLGIVGSNGGGKSTLLSLPQSLPELERERFQTILLRVSY